MKNRRRGVTFLEILFSVALLAVAMLPIIQTSQSSIRRTGFNIHRVTATMLSNQLMERYRSMPFDWLEENFGAGEIDMKEIMKKDSLLASPALPKSYMDILEKYEVSAKFEDVSGDESLGLLSFKVKWRASRNAPKTELSLGKAVINYEKFGIKTVNTQGGFLQSGDNSISRLNTDWDSDAPSTASDSGVFTPSNSSSSPGFSFPEDPFTTINTLGSPGC